MKLSRTRLIRVIKGRLNDPFAGFTKWYVRKNGNDTTGNGSSATPWLTVSKALATISTAANQVLLIGDGVYTENTGGNHYLLIQKVFASFLTIQGENGATSNVTITGETSTTYQTRIDGCSHLRFKYIKFDSNVDMLSGSTGTVHCSGSTNSYIEFINCTLIWRSHAVNATWAMISDISSTTNFNNFLFDTCTFTQTGTSIQSGSAAIRFSKGSGTPTLDTITIRNCLANVTGIPIYINGVTNLTIDGGSFISDSQYGTIIGIDGPGGKTSTGKIINSPYFQSTSGHALLIGSGATNFTVSAPAVRGGNQGLVVKLNDSTVITNPTITSNPDGSTLNALYFKGATNASVTGANVTNSAGNVLKIGIDSGTSTKCQNISVTHCNISGTGTAGLIA